MRHILLLLLLVGWNATAAITSITPPAFSGNFRSVGNEQQLTNAINSATPGDWIVIEPGRYYFPSPTLTFASPHVSYYAMPGVEIIIGDGTDTTGVPFGYSSAATNWFYGHARFNISNLTQLVSMTDASAMLHLEFESAHRRRTNFATGVFEQDAGYLWARWSDFVRSDSYDIYVNLFGDAGDPNCFVHLEGPRWEWGDSCLEVNSFTTMGRATFIGENADALNNVHVSPSGIGSSFVGSNVVVRFSRINNNTNHQWDVVGSAIFFPSPLMSKTGFKDVSSVNAVATDAATTEKDLMNITIPAGTLSITNQALELLAWGRFGATANNKDIRVKMGGVQVLDTLPRANNAQEWIMSGIFQYTSASVIKSAMKFEVTGFVTNDISSLTLNGSTNIVLRITGSNHVAAASDIVLEGWKVKWTP